MCCCLPREIEMCVLSSGMAALTPYPSQTTEINWDLLEELPEKFLPQNVVHWEKLGLQRGILSVQVFVHGSSSGNSKWNI